MLHLRLSMVLAATVAVGLAMSAAPYADASSPAAPTTSAFEAPGAVFVQTDDLTHNAVIAYDRGPDGHLTRAGTYATGGAGAVVNGAVVDPLASQGSLTLDRTHHLLFAVNGGSDTVTVFSVDGSRLVRRQVLATHGELPVSVSVAGDLVYVLNARGAGP